MKKLLIGSVLLLTACSVAPVETPVVPEVVEPEAVVEEAVVPSAVIDFASIAEGELLGGMTVESIGKPNGNTRPIGETNIKIDFTGEVELTGTVEVMPEESAFLAGRACMKNLSVESLALLPHRADQENSPYVLFCFEEGFLAIADAGFDNGQTYTVKIDRYTFIGFEGEAVNEARLLEVVQSGGRG
jgi:hypothetical protein